MTKKQRAKDLYLKRTYGISLRDYNRKLRGQGHACWMCKKHKSQFKKSLAVDHNHKNGIIRGLVCYHCNKFKIGRNDITSATLLYRYMLQFEGDDK